MSNINWSEKNTLELQKYFKTKISQGLSKKQYLASKAKHGENIIESDILEQQNFYGLQKKKRNMRAVLTGSAGVIGIIYFLTVTAFKLMGNDVNLYIFLPIYFFLVLSAFILSTNSEKKYEYLYKMARPKALVLREGKRKKVFIENIVPGDVIILSAGDIVPADARIVSAARLSCVHADNDGNLKKENKTNEILKYNPTERSGNIVYAADIVDSGSAVAVVIATGDKTYIAGLAENNDTYEDITPDIIKPSLRDEYSFMQKCANKISKVFFLISIGMSMVIIFTGIFQNRDTISVILTFLTAAAACFIEQIPIIADFAVIHGMHKLSKTGILIKKTTIIDEINAVDTLIAKKTESFTQDKISLVKISDVDVTMENSSRVGYILSCMAMCSSVAEYSHGGGRKKTSYTGSAIDVSVFEALDRCGLSYDAVGQVYQKIGKTLYNPKNSIKSAVVLKGGRFSLVCFGEAFNILERCIRRTDVMGRLSEFDRRSFDFFREKAGDLYKEYDLVMAVAIRDFNYSRENIGLANSEPENNLTFLGFACFSQPKTAAVFQSIDNLKKSGITPVMISDTDAANTKSAAVKFGIARNLKSAHIISDEEIKTMGDNMFYIRADKLRLFTPISLENRTKLLKALKFRKKYPATTINDIEEISLLNEKPNVAFSSVSAETGILKNKASVITKNLTVSTIVKTVRSAVLIYRNVCQIAHYSSMIFISQYLLILFASLFFGAYMLSPLQIIWSGIGAGYIFAVSICFNEENKNWDILRKEIKKQKSRKKLNKIILKYGLICGLFMFVFSAASFLVCFNMKSSGSGINIIKDYINSHNADSVNIKSAQTAAFITYVVSCITMALHYIKGWRFFDLRIIKNKVFGIALALNVIGILCAVFIPQARDFLGFGEIGLNNFIISIILGIFPFIITRFFGKNIFFERGRSHKK